MTKIRTSLSPALLVLLLLGALSCSRSDEQASSGGEDAQAQALVIPALVGEPLDALDLVIVMNSISSARGWNRSLDLSPSLQARLSKYDGKVQFDVQIKGVSEPLLSNGAKTEIPTGATFDFRLTGALNAEVHVLSGEVGVLDGEVFVSEGTEATVNGGHYKYAKGQWIESNPGSRQ